MVLFLLYMESDRVRVATTQNLKTAVNLVAQYKSRSAEEIEVVAACEGGEELKERILSKFGVFDSWLAKTPELMEFLKKLCPEQS